jgi:hypothetical protein
MQQIYITQMAEHDGTPEGCGRVCNRARGMKRVIRFPRFLLMPIGILFA